MAVYDADGNLLSVIYDADGIALSVAYSADGEVIYRSGEVIPVPSLEAYSSGYIDDNGNLTALSNNRVSDVYRSATGKVTVVVAEKELPNVNVIRIAEYDANKSFIQRQYIQRYNFYEFTLDEDTRFVRVGFQAINSPDWNDLFTYYQTTTSPILCSQIGYDTNKTKRATVIGKDGDAFQVANSANAVVYSGTVNGGVADFSSFTTPGTYYLYCDGARSWSFKIAENRLWSVMAKPAIDFMEQARLDAWDVGANTGYAWRDSAQFSFELNSLVMQYASNPSYYKSLPWNIYNIGQTEYTELRTQDCPDIIWLLKFAITRYYDWNINDEINLHALVKQQIAYFLWLYPYISEYIDATWYQTIRDWAISIWSVETCDPNKAWADTPINHNLFTTQSAIGGIKGSCPPGYAVVSNFLMYEVCTRDGLSSASAFMTAAENNIAWLVNSVDLTDPQYTKGQRMSEYITFHALTYAYEMYPSHCPSGTYAKILEVAQLFIYRAENEWDYVQYQTAGESQSINETIWVNNSTGGTANQPGNTAGFMAVAYSLARVISDSSVKARLKELAVTQMDHVFGRNPLNRCFSYDAVRDFDGAKQGWVTQTWGAGDLNWVTAVLDGSPKNVNYPYNPAGSTGYTEGWVAFNSAWNMSLAYLNGENSSITDGIGLFATGT